MKHLKFKFDPGEKAIEDLDTAIGRGMHRIGAAVNHPGSEERNGDLHTITFREDELRALHIMLLAMMVAPVETAHLLVPNFKN